MLDFKLATTDEICLELGGRLKASRLTQGFQQAELALRAGVSRGTVAALENKGQSTVESLVRIVKALGLDDQLSGLFVMKVRSIADMERQQATARVRASRRRA
jgi:transcriptional regulator with XRE-family HTH domain